MKNYFKKFSIMFVMLLAVIGAGVIQNGSVANAATDDGVVGTSNLNNTAENSAKVGDALKSPEIGWKRYDDSDSRFTYTGDLWGVSSPDIHWYNNDAHYNAKGNVTNDNINDNYVTFKFKGTKIRIILYQPSDQSYKQDIIIDGITETHTALYGNQSYNILNYEKTGLSDAIHTVTVKCNLTGMYPWLRWDAIDINDDGYLVDQNSQASSIILDNSSMNLTVDDSKQLTATTTPASAEVIWTSSDTSIATVDSTGKVTGIKEGTATITAQIKGSETKATCVVTVTPKSVDPQSPVEPTNPTEPTGDANLFIELVDGNIKSYNVSSIEIAKFKQWYLDRDNTTSNKPYYEFSKGSYKDYVVHSKIDWFEVR